MRREAASAAVMAVFAFCLLACDDVDDREGAQPTAPTVDATATLQAPFTPEALSDAAPATVDGCPIDDAVICQFAIGLQAALHAGEIDFVASRLAPEVLQCRDVIHASDEDVGCETPDDTSDPLVFFLVTQGDCCSTSTSRFAASLEGLLRGATSRPGAWRIHGIVTGSQLWRGQPSILLMRGTEDPVPLLDVGTVILDGRVAIAGAIHGSRTNYLVFPEGGAQLLRWD